MFQTVASLPEIAPVRPAADPETTDARLLAAVVAGDHAAFEQIYVRHADAVMTVALGVCRNHAAAEEIAQDAFTALWERASRLQAKALHLRPWLTTVARNAAIDRLRAGEGASLAIDAAERRAGDEPSPETAAIAAEASAELRDAIALLPREQRTVIGQLFFAGMSPQQIADETGTPVGTVKSRRRLALARLRELLGAG